MKETLEEMRDFFNRRVAEYEGHMLACVDGADQFYRLTASLLPVRPGMRLLDLGCGTGLELDELYRLQPDARVTGVDLAEKMLDALRAKHADKPLTLLRQSYFDAEFARGAFDAAISVQSLHHFTYGEKLALYKKLHTWLIPGGVYVETDYTAPDQVYEDLCFAERARLLREQGAKEGFFHYDTPHTLAHRAQLLREAGFKNVREVWKQKCTSILVANT